MHRNRIQLQIIASSVFVIVFNVLFFLFGGVTRPAGEWITYLFVIIAYATTICTPIVVRAEKQGSLGTSFEAVSLFYFAVELLVAVVVFMAKPDSSKMVFAIQLVLLGAFIVVAIYSYISNTKTIENEAMRRDDILFIKCASSTIEGIANIADDREIKKALHLLYDTMHSSPAKSDPTCYEIEDSIKNELAELESMISQKTDSDSVKKKISEIQQQLNIRNMKLRNLQ